MKHSLAIICSRWRGEKNFCVSFLIRPACQDFLKIFLLSLYHSIAFSLSFSRSVLKRSVLHSRSQFAFITHSLSLSSIPHNALSSINIYHLWYTQHFSESDFIFLTYCVDDFEIFFISDLFYRLRFITVTFLCMCMYNTLNCFEYIRYIDNIYIHQSLTSAVSIDVMI